MSFVNRTQFGIDLYNPDSFFGKYLSIEEGLSRLNILQNEQKNSSQRGENLSHRSYQELKELATVFSEAQSFARTAVMISRVAPVNIRDSDRGRQTPDFYYVEFHKTPAKKLQSISEAIAHLSRYTELPQEVKGLNIAWTLSDNQPSMHSYSAAVFGKIEHILTKDFIEGVESLHIARLQVLSSARDCSYQGQISEILLDLYHETPKLHAALETNFNHIFEQTLLRHLTVVQTSLCELHKLIRVEHYTHRDTIEVAPENFERARSIVAIELRETEKLFEKINLLVQNFFNRFSSFESDIDRSLQAIHSTKETSARLASILFNVKKFRNVIEIIKSTIKSQTRWTKSLLSNQPHQLKTNTDLLIYLNKFMEKILNIHALWLQNKKHSLILSKVIHDEIKLSDLATKDVYESTSRGYYAIADQLDLLLSNRTIHLKIPSNEHVLQTVISSSQDTED